MKELPRISDLSSDSLPRQTLGVISLFGVAFTIVSNLSELLIFSNLVRGLVERYDALIASVLNLFLSIFSLSVTKETAVFVSGILFLLIAVVTSAIGREATKSASYVEIKPKSKNLIKSRRKGWKIATSAVLALWICALIIFVFSFESGAEVQSNTAALSFLALLPLSLFLLRYGSIVLLAMTCKNRSPIRYQLKDADRKRILRYMFILLALIWLPFLELATSDTEGIEKYWTMFMCVLLGLVIPIKVLQWLKFRSDVGILSNRLRASLLIVFGLITIAYCSFGIEYVLKL